MCTGTQAMYARVQFKDASFDAHAKLYLQNCCPWDMWLFGACENVNLIDSQTAG